MPDTSNNLVCRGGETSAYRLIWGRLHICALLLVVMLSTGCTSEEPVLSDRLFAVEKVNAADDIGGVDQPSRSLLRMARYFHDRDKSGTAVVFYERAVLASSEADELVEIGDLLVELGAIEQGANSYRRALGLDHQSLDARLGLGSTLILQGRVDEAVNYFKKLEDAVDPPSPRLCNAVAAALDLGARHREAQAAYRRCLDIDPDDHNVRANLALSLALSGDHREAAQLGRDIVGSSGASDKDNRNLVLILALAGDRTAAEHFGDIALGPTQTARLLDFADHALAIDEPLQRAEAIGLGRSRM